MKCGFPLVVGLLGLSAMSACDGMSVVGGDAGRVDDLHIPFAADVATADVGDVVDAAVIDGGAMIGCPIGTIACRGACVDPSSDAAHCGRCENACPANETCQQGTCAACPSGRSFCAGICCPSGQACGSDGRCAPCPSMQGFCNGVCCPESQVCRPGGGCSACPAGQAFCDGMCCPASQVCQAGACMPCAPGRPYCNGVCCPDSQVCQGGRCAACPATMAYVPGGTFTMGAADLDVRTGDVFPHLVHVDPYCLDVTEVTVEDYQTCTAPGCTPGGAGRFCSQGRVGAGRNPINCVGWRQAAAYCASRGANLPTEAQWEFAARGAVVEPVYPWGMTAPAGQLCWGGGPIGTRAGTCPVRSFPAGDFGLYDMAGNVWEWTRDCYAPYPHHSGLVAEPDIQSASPAGCSYRVVRGGGWGTSAEADVRAAARSGLAHNFDTA